MLLPEAAIEAEAATAEAKTASRCLGKPFGDKYPVGSTQSKMKCKKKNGNLLATRKSK